MHRENRPPCRNTRCQHVPLCLLSAPNPSCPVDSPRTARESEIRQSRNSTLVPEGICNLEIPGCGGVTDHRKSSADYSGAPSWVNASSTNDRSPHFSGSAISQPRKQEKLLQSGKDSTIAQKKAVTQPARSGTGNGVLPPEYCTADHLPRRQRLRPPPDDGTSAPPTRTLSTERPFAKPHGSDCQQHSSRSLQRMRLGTSVDDSGTSK